MAKKSNVGGVVSTLLDGVRDLSRSETIVGEPQETGGATIIPVHRLRVTFGAGTTKAGAHGKRLGGDGNAYAAVGAVDLDPLAAIAVSADGKAQLLTVEQDSVSTWSNLVAEVPGLVNRVARLISEKVDSRSVTQELAEESEPAKQLTEGEE